MFLHLNAKQHYYTTGTGENMTSVQVTFVTAQSFNLQQLEELTASQ